MHGLEVTALISLLSYRAADSEGSLLTTCGQYVLHHMYTDNITWANKNMRKLGVRMEIKPFYYGWVSLKLSKSNYVQTILHSEGLFWS